MVAAPWVRSSDRRIRQEAEDIAGRFGLEPWADNRTSELGLGRMVQHKSWRADIRPYRVAAQQHASLPLASTETVGVDVDG